MTCLELQASTHGTWHGTPPSGVSGLSTDTRTLKKGEAFLALRGPTFDGHRFAGEAMRRGASVLIGDSAGDVPMQEATIPRLEVSNTLDALGHIAAAWRRQLSATVVGITGSYGKTTVRSMLEHGLRRLGLNVAATKANNNNLVGVPQTILGMEKDADVALVECGISEAGEMQRLAGMVRPDIAVMTGLAPAHAEGLGDVRGVTYEKGLLLQHLTPDGCAVLGAGVSAMMHTALPAHVACMEIDDLTNASVVHWRMRGHTCELQLAGEMATVELAMPARHWAADMAIAATVIRYLTQKHIKDIAASLSTWRTAPGRMQTIPCVDGSTVIHDAYNANPASMNAALDTLRAMPGRHFAVLGDMAELGEMSRVLHAALDVFGISGLILAGSRMQALAARCGSAQWVPDADAAIPAVKALNLCAGDVVLVKGSRCMRLEKVVDALTQNGTEAPMDGRKREKVDAV